MKPTGLEWSSPDALSQVLSQVLDGLHLKTMITRRLEFKAPWQLRVEPADSPRSPQFYMILQGDAWLNLDGVEPVHLECGNVAVLPCGRAHFLRNIDDHGAVASLICGYLLFDRYAIKPLRMALPSLIHLREGNAVPWLGEWGHIIAQESDAKLAGANAIIHHLAHILLIVAVRVHMAAISGGIGRTGNWLRALLDPQIGSAMTALHTNPERPWTVASLAQHAKMSRSAFAKRFTAEVGQPPLHYLLDYRMQKACALLRTGSIPKEVAATVGYDSIAGFNGAFKRWAGMSPSAYGRTRQAETSEDKRRGPDIFHITGQDEPRMK